MIAEHQSSALQQSSEYTFMSSKVGGLKQRLQVPFPYFYSVLPKDIQSYTRAVQEFKAKLKESPTMSEQLQKYQGMGLGKIEGMAGNASPIDTLTQYFGYQNKQFWQEFTKDKLILKNNGVAKQKNYTIWQVKDIQQIKQYYSLQQIKKQRKIIKQYSTLYKSIHKFVDKFEKVQSQEEVMVAYEDYKKVEQEDAKMNKMLISQGKFASKGKQVEVCTAPVIAVTAVMANGANGRNGVEGGEKMENQGVGNQKESQKQKDRPKQESEKVENAQLSSNKDEVNNEPIPELEKSNQKQKQGIPSEAKQSKKKTQPKEQGSTKKQAKVVVDKKKEELSKYKSLDFFFKKKPEIETTPKSHPTQQQTQKQDKTNTFLSSLVLPPPPLQTLKLSYRCLEKPSLPSPHPIYTTIHMLRSRLEYQNHLIFPRSQINYLCPYSQLPTIHYNDSSDEYSQLVADSINEEMVQEEDEEEEQQYNSAIVSDSFCQYKSSHVMSSDQDDEDEEEGKGEKKVKVVLGRSMEKWGFVREDAREDRRERMLKYEMMCLVEEIQPLVVRDMTEQSNTQITATQKLEMYRQLHGSYTPKQVVIKKLCLISQNKISQNKLSTLIKDICQKKGIQRTLKPQIIRQLAEELADTYPNLQADLQVLRSQREAMRNLEVQAKREEKRDQRDQRVDKLILEYEGEVTIHLLLAYLRQYDIKLHKQELSTIIKTKQGQKWQHIRNEIKKHKLARGRPKKNKTAEAPNNELPLEEMFKHQDAKPKKENKRKTEGEQEGEGMQMIDENEEDREDEEEHEPSDDQSFDLHRKPAKKSKTSKRKQIVKINPLLPPVRRNPKRNHKKPKRYSEPTNKEHLEEQGNQNKQPNMQEQQEQEQVEKQENQVLDEMQEEQQGQQEQEQIDSEVKDIGNVERGNVGTSSQLAQEKQKIEGESPMRMHEEQKKQGENNEKTANKIGQAQPGPM